MQEGDYETEISTLCSRLRQFPQQTQTISHN